MTGICSAAVACLRIEVSGSTITVFPITAKFEEKAVIALRKVRPFLSAFSPTVSVWSGYRRWELRRADLG